MYHWVRQYSAKIGKLDELLSLTSEAIKHLEKTHNVKCVAYTKIGGDPTTIGLHGSYASLAEVGDIEQALANDNGWSAIAKQAESLIVEGSVQDQIWKELP